MIGKIISHYKILEKLGKGGMGIVYKAEDIKLKRMVALKFLPPEMTRNPEATTRFIHEAQAASALDHQNICTIHEINETEDGQMFIVMNCYEGKMLRDKIECGPLKIDETINIASQIAQGMARAHEKGIVHRDIKPANLFIASDGIVKILDFGLAKLKGLTKLTKTGSTLGTVAYMSPEQAMGKDVDERSDIWSLGVIIYEMLTGKLPFRGEYEQAVLYAVINEEPESISKLRSDIPDELKHIIRKLLTKNPENRYQTAAELLKELQRFNKSIMAPETVSFDVKRFLLRPKIVIPAVLIISFITILSVLFFQHRAKVHWARKQALPEIERLISENDVWRDLTVAYRLAEKAEKYIPHDPKLVELFSKCSLPINIKTEPPGANIYMQEYKTPNSEWKLLGVSPIEKIRLPIGIFRWKMEKEGYETVLAASSTWDIDIGTKKLLIPFDIVRVLDKKESAAPGMVRVQGAETALGKLNDFYIDRFEVTNKEYKEFMNNGGYRNRNYWKQKIIKDGKELTWEKAIKEFIDPTGQPGPSTWQAGDYPAGQGDYPVSGISWYEAAAYAEFAGKSLPTGHHWGIAMGEYTPLIQWPQLGGFALFAPFSNFGDKGLIPVGSLPGITSYGAFDMAGNVREWCWNETYQGRLIRGGAWDENTYMFIYLSQAPSMDRSAKNGFRCALYPDPEKMPSSVFQMEKSLGSPLLGERVDFYKMKPVTDPVFHVYKEQFNYDRTDLNARVESSRESPGGWIQEKITFDAAYGRERVIAYLFIPKNTIPPYQTTIYFPGDASFVQRSSEDLESYYEFSMFLSYIVKDGRAVLYPVYKGTFERGNDALAAVYFGDWNTHQYTEFLIQQIKDFKRCIDYLETRQDIDSDKIAYYGMSQGGVLGAIIPAVEERLKASILLGGGLMRLGRPEVNQINYVTRVKTPTLMLNGRYDNYFPTETSQKPMLDLLATPAEHKQLKLYETDHIPPRNEFIKETLFWLDKYLGPVSKKY
ncbi:MAG: protein kinase [Candidatus Helarchaeota archaeon]|nr:protein kinase [Candidatus Helarchaeota archaeon]